MTARAGAAARASRRRSPAAGRAGQRAIDRPVQPRARRSSRGRRSRPAAGALLDVRARERGDGARSTACATRAASSAALDRAAAASAPPWSAHHAPADPPAAAGSSDAMQELRSQDVRGAVRPAWRRMARADLTVRRAPRTEPCAGAQRRRDRPRVGHAERGARRHARVAGGLRAHPRVAVADHRPGRPRRVRRRRRLGADRHDVGRGAAARRARSPRAIEDVAGGAERQVGAVASAMRRAPRRVGEAVRGTADEARATAQAADEVPRGRPQRRRARRRRDRVDGRRALRASADVSAAIGELAGRSDRIGDIVRRSPRSPSRPTCWR